MNKCSARTKTGERCKLDAGESGLCHIHDPRKLYRQQRREELAQRQKANRVKKSKRKKKVKRCRHNGFVYMFWLGFKGTYKIGFSKSWGDRLIALQASNPNMKPVIVITGSKQLEEEIHVHLGQYNLEREIYVFDKTSQAMDAIRYIMDKGKVDFIIKNRKINELDYHDYQYSKPGDDVPWKT